MLIIYIIQIFIILFLAFGINTICLANGDSGDHMSEKIIEIDLVIEALNDKLIANLKFKNVSMDPIYLDKHNVSLSYGLKSRLFDIYSENNNKVKYTGITIKRKFNKNDFIKLLPNESISTSVSLDDWYDFVDGTNSYTVKYDTDNHSYENQNMFEMTSNVVHVKY